ncbi:L,D-transpeptidase family protein [Parvibaculum sedimenti]|uniref:L,D-transpeptidase family protein n=1 Tax=Parvibaculum sedimenti TaxID=2608632 RepID=A0A6N6VQ80_9HYPH|nr:L,D-transpeptidase family protein [Parvibaculum sedimenti]KAB7742347.1 L,D-transpeptidase family protein [Parvibaculum sedimenti]
MNIHVTALPGRQQGVLRFGGEDFPCALGRSGIVTDKREGDGGTPVGSFALRELFFRPDRLAKPATILASKPIAADDGWCDASGDVAYNRPVKLPYPASAETLWREDHLYDLIVPLGYNDDPVRPGAGSAIFFHLAKEDGSGLAATEGCVALRLADMLHVLAHVTPETRMIVELASAA